MFSLAYTPAYDPYHTAFRYLVLLSKADDQKIQMKIARAADFYLCFPWALAQFKAPRDIKGFARAKNQIIKKYPQSEYEHYPNARTVFDRMEIIQTTAVSALAGAQLIDAQLLRAGTVKLNKNEVSAELLHSLDKFYRSKPDLVDFLAQELTQVEETGNDGIFARSGLGDFKYDVIST